MTVHDYRKAIDDRCIIGMCSMNNCLFPSCVTELHNDLRLREEQRRRDQMQIWGDPCPTRGEQGSISQSQSACETTAVANETDEGTSADRTGTAIVIVAWLYVFIAIGAVLLATGIEPDMYRYWVIDVPCILLMMGLAFAPFRKRLL